jgi:hypothetical protein
MSENEQQASGNKLFGGRKVLLKEARQSEEITALARREQDVSWHSLWLHRSSA